MTTDPASTPTPEAKTNLRSPSGISLAPDPPTAVTISRKAILVGVFGLAGVIGLVLLGMYGRQHRQATMNQRTGDDQKPSAATAAANELVSEIAPKEVEPTPGVTNRPGDAARTKSGFRVPALRAPDGFSTNQNQQIRQGGQPLNAQVELSAEEKLRVEDYERERQAIAAPTLIRTAGVRAPEGPTAAAVPAASALASELSALAHAALPHSSGGLEEVVSALRGAPSNGTASNGFGAEHPGNYELQNQQDQKLGFSSARKPHSSDYLESTRALPLSKYEIKAGWDIPATLEQAVNSDLPGEVKALVRSNVYDTATGHYLLIPQGARLVGTYNSRIAYGQRGVQVLWNRIIYPDGSSLDLGDRAGDGGMTGTDTAGNAGFRSGVDNHYKRLLGFAALTSLFSAGVELGQNGGGGGGSVLQGPNAGQMVSAAVGQQLGELGVEITRRNLNIQPTIHIPIGYRFNVRVGRDILFDAPYSPVRM